MKKPVACGYHRNIHKRTWLANQLC